MPFLDLLPSLSDADRATIQGIATALQARWPVDRLVLYGSKARGDDTPESDIDLLVLTGRQMTPAELADMRAESRRIGLARGTWPELYVRTSEEWNGLYLAAPIHKEIDAEGLSVTLDAGARAP
jgi:predicted nucleotidyltransferase